MPEQAPTRLLFVAAGMDCAGTLTGAADAALAGADVIIAAPRVLAGLARYPAEKVSISIPEDIAAWLSRNPARGTVAVAFGGDIGFHSGAKKLISLLPGREVELCCGVSCVQYFAARLGRPWQDFHLVSGHGKPCDVLAETLNHAETFFLTGPAFTPEAIAEELCRHGLSDALLHVGENLGSAAERIRSLSAGAARALAFPPLCVVLAENVRSFSSAPGPAGLADSEFLRGTAPMSKRAVRAMALALLAPTPDALLYDIGAGTGSVAVEMALQARRGRVYAVERDGAALELLAANREKFGAYNIVPVGGAAPAAIAALPVPDGAFIGGSGGALAGILEALLEKNPGVRVVVSAITLETLATALATMERLGMNAEITQIAASHARAVGSSHMMLAENPVFLIAGGRA